MGENEVNGIVDAAKYKLVCEERDELKFELYKIKNENQRNGNKCITKPLVSVEQRALEAQVASLQDELKERDIIKLELEKYKELYNSTFKNKLNDTLNVSYGVRQDYDQRALEAQVESLQDELKVVKGRVSQLEEKNKQLENELVAQRNEVHPLASELRASETHVASLQDQLQKLQRRYDILKQQYDKDMEVYNTHELKNGCKTKACGHELALKTAEMTIVELRKQIEDLKIKGEGELEIQNTALQSWMIKYKKLEKAFDAAFLEKKQLELEIQTLSNQKNLPTEEERGNPVPKQNSETPTDKEQKRPKKRRGQVDKLNAPPQTKKKTEVRVAEKMPENEDVTVLDEIANIGSNKTVKNVKRTKRVPKKGQQEKKLEVDKENKDSPDLKRPPPDSKATTENARARKKKSPAPKKDDKSSPAAPVTRCLRSRK